VQPVRQETTNAKEEQLKNEGEATTLNEARLLRQAIHICKLLQKNDIGGTKQRGKLRHKAETYRLFKEIGQPAPRTLDDLPLCLNKLNEALEGELRELEIGF